MECRQGRSRRKGRRCAFLRVHDSSLGGIGMMWEHIIHRLYKRALRLDSFIAGQAELYRRVADQVLDTTTATA